jgi:hypothetical protein
LLPELENVSDWTIERHWKALCGNLQSANELKLGKVAQPLRAALTGSTTIATHLRRTCRAWARRGTGTPTGAFTYDPGFTSTGSCESEITYIDGDKGILLHRGYPIDQLAEHGDFLETCYLLLYGELPTSAQKADFDNRVTRHTMLHEQMARFFTGFRRDAHPMAIMCAAWSAPCRPSITTRPTFLTRTSGWWPRFA